MTEHLRTYEKGQVIFVQGSPGGDLFFIKEGEVEIFVTSEGHDVVLSTMKAGEVIGTLTLMTSESRLASARAASKVVVQHVAQKQVMKAVHGIPKWMLIVLKDFTGRLNVMNERYIQSENKLRKANAEPITVLYCAMQLACTIAECADSKKMKFDDNNEIVPKNIIDYVAPMLFSSPELYHQIFEIFIRSGMLQIQFDKAKSLEYIPLKIAQNLRSFSAFYKELARKKVVACLESKFGEKEIIMIEGLLKYAAAKKADLSHAVKYKVDELGADFQAVTSIPYNGAAFSAAELLKIIHLEGAAETQTITFEQKTIQTGIAQVRAYNMLKDLEKARVKKPEEHKPEEKKTEDKKEAA